MTHKIPTRMMLLNNIVMMLANYLKPFLAPLRTKTQAMVNERYTNINQQ